MEKVRPLNYALTVTHKLKHVWVCLTKSAYQSPGGVLEKSCSEKSPKIHRKTYVP